MKRTGRSIMIGMAAMALSLALNTGRYAQVRAEDTESATEQVSGRENRPGTGPESVSAALKTADETLPDPGSKSGERAASESGSTAEGGAPEGDGNTSGSGAPEGDGNTSGDSAPEGNGSTSGVGAPEGGGSTSGGGTPEGGGNTSGGSQPGEDGTSPGSGQPPAGEPSTEPGTEKPQWPQGRYMVRIRDAAVRVPEGGRVYDGTDRIEVTFQTQIDRIPESTGGKDDSDEQKQGETEEEETPEYHVACNARLESADAGERKVICSFVLQTSFPDHVKLDETTTDPDLRVTVKKAVLRVHLPDGTKRYGDPADPEHIHLNDKDAVSVSGFVRDPAGNEIIPPGFELPQMDVDPSVLQQWSPIYDQQEELLTGTVSIRQYRHALVLKRDSAGNLTGNPTGNYEFCSDPADERLTGGTVTIERAPVIRGTTYELKGEKGAYRIDADGGVIVRSGTGLRAEPLAGQGYNTGAKITGIRGDTYFTFRLEMRAADGTLAADSMEETVPCLADGSAPDAQTQILGASSSGGFLFSASSASVAVTVPEDTVSGLDFIRCRVLSGPVQADSLKAGSAGAPLLPSAGEWREIGRQGTVNLSGEGIYAVEVEVRDQVGNTSLARSQAVAIDSTAPGIEITGVEDGSANASALHIAAQCQDPAYLPGSLKAEIKADFGGVTPSVSVGEGSPNGATLTFGDFPRRREADAVYHLTVTASDRAGNLARKQLSFSVNRFGSSYGLADQTASRLKKFYHTRPFDVTFLETNLDQVGDARVLLRAGERLEELRAGSGLTVSESRTDKGFSRYAYTVPASRFAGDGTYEVMLLTTDRAGNSSDSSAQRLPVRFAIDTAAPECLVSGIAPEGRYQEKELTAVIEVRDNQALEKAEVYVDARKAAVPETDRSGGAGEIIKIRLSEKEAWQTVQVHAGDKAGNEIWTREIPVYISTKDPEGAEAYRGGRLSAQQMELIRRLLDRIRRKLAGSILFAGRTPSAGTGIVRNLYQAALRDDVRNAPSMAPAPAVQSEDVRRDSGPPAFLIAGIAAVIAVFLAGAGCFLYRRRYFTAG